MAKKKDEPGGDEKGKGTSPEVEPKTTPEPEPGPAPKPEEETFTYTKTERDDYVNAQKAGIGRQLSDALSVNTTLKRTMDGNKTRMTNLETTINTEREARRAKEIKDAAGDAEVIDGLTLKHKNEDESTRLSRERSDFDQVRAQHRAAIDKSAKFEATEEAKELAKTSGLTADLLLQIGSDTAEDGRVTYNLDRMKDIASKSPKGGDEEEEESEEETASTPAKGLRAKARSTGRTPTNLRTFADYEKAYAEGQISREEFGKAAKRFNIQL